MPQGNATREEVATNIEYFEYIKEAKECGDKHYQQLYDEYLQPKEMNFEFRAIIDGNDVITLYFNIAPKGIKWVEVQMSDFIIRK